MLFFFFFSSRRRHTRFSRDWSSDVCSSDLGEVEVQVQPAGGGVEGGPGHLPGLGKTKSGLEQVIDVRHQRSSRVGLEEEPYRLTETLPTRFSEEPDEFDGTCAIREYRTRSCGVGAIGSAAGCASYPPGRVGPSLRAA